MFSQSYIQPPSSQTSLYSTNNTLGFADLAPNFGSQSDLGVLGSQDTNSPDAFKQNIMVVIEQLARVQVFARNIINGMYVRLRMPLQTYHFNSHPFGASEQAYRPGTNPSQTSGKFHLTCRRKEDQECLSSQYAQPTPCNRNPTGVTSHLRSRRSSSPEPATASCSTIAFGRAAPCGYNQCYSTTFRALEEPPRELHNRHQFT